MDAPPPTDPVPAIPYETPGDPPANVVVLMRLGILLLAAIAVQYFFSAFIGALPLLTFGRSMHGYMWGYILSTAAVSTAWLAVLWVLWRRTPVLANRLFSRNSLQQEKFAGSADLLGAAVIAIGVYETVEGIYSMMDILMLMISGTSRSQYPPGREWIPLVPMVIRSCIGLWLIFGSGSILAFLRRHSGRYRDKLPSPADRPSEADQTHPIIGS